MADNYLITGYWGEPHVTAENDRGINAGMTGEGKYVLPVGEQFRAEYIGNNTVRLYDGKLMDNGAAAGIPTGQYIDFLIANAGAGMKRVDWIVFQYEKDPSTLIESGKFVVISGNETSGQSTSNPTISRDNNLLLEETTFDQMELWEIVVNGTEISEPVQLFKNASSLANLSVDYVVEEGSPEANVVNSPWYWRRWKSGRVDLWGKITINSVSCSTAMGSLFRTDTCTYNFPVTIQNGIGTAFYTSNSGNGAMLWNSGFTDTQFKCYYIRATSGTIKGELNLYISGTYSA